jgi:hypothetical protein
MTGLSLRCVGTGHSLRGDRAQFALRTVSGASSVTRLTGAALRVSLPAPAAEQQEGMAGVAVGRFWQ